MQTIKNVTLSLIDLLGESYMDAVCQAKAFIEQKNVKQFVKIAHEKIDFFPPEFLRRVNELIDLTGKKVCDGFPGFMQGATTNAFAEATKTNMAPLSTMGVSRIGEDGRAYLISKSEHYHAPMGHGFPGYKLIVNAVNLGITNATPNNTRGYITRLLEEELVRVANGISKDDRKALEQIIRSDDPNLLNRVINMETGSLAVEAALKMMLARFYRLDKTYAEPEYAGRIPVFLVIADNVGGKEANYHGTTIFTQMMRGMWPDFYQILDEKGLFKVVPVKINDTKYFENVVVKYDEGKYKIAGFFHEIILMNYGGIVLTKDYLKQVYRICKNRDIPVLVDEIQSCIWSPELFMFKEYDLKPDFVSIGKGFPGGQYPASKILTTAKMDNLNLFGALVTNGQVELASMAYLITIAFVEENKKYIKALGSYYEQEIRNMEREFNHIITKVEGVKHTTTIFFENAEKAVRFSTYLSSRGIDISTQAYKADVPPSALTKLPLIATPKMVDFIIQTMREALNKFQNIEINDLAV